MGIGNDIEIILGQIKEANERIECVNKKKNSILANIMMALDVIPKYMWDIDLDNVHGYYSKDSSLCLFKGKQCAKIHRDGKSGYYSEGDEIIFSWLRENIDRIILTVLFEEKKRMEILADIKEANIECGIIGQ